MFLSAFHVLSRPCRAVVSAPLRLFFAAFPALIREIHVYSEFQPEPQGALDSLHHRRFQLAGQSQQFHHLVSGKALSVDIALIAHPGELRQFHLVGGLMILPGEGEARNNRQRRFFIRHRHNQDIWVCTLLKRTHPVVV